MNSKNLPTITDVRKAYSRLKNHALNTPILESHKLNESLGCRILVKAENLQRTGSFKFRGAFNKISMIKKKNAESRIVAFSSGNHGQGVAAAAKYFNLPATIVMPSDAPKIKIENTIDYGAEVILYDRRNRNRVEIAKDIIRKTGAILVPPYDDPDIISGQGTIGLEIADRLKKMNIKLDSVIGPSSGGGMMSGCSLALKDHNPHISLFCVEPEYYDDLSKSLKSGRREKIKPKTQSICDALLLETPGNLTFKILKKFKAKGLTASDHEALKAMKVAFKEFKLVLEPSAALPLASILKNSELFKNKTVALIFTGGNVDPKVFKKALALN